MDAPEPKRRWAELRRAAESRLRIAGAQAPGTKLEREELIHELQLQQIELEMQNEELLAAHAEIARGFVRYQRLHDLAPVGCVTLDRSGRVQESNYRVATMLGVDRRGLSGTPLQKFMPALSADIFHRHLRAVFAHSARQTCKIVLERHGAKPGSFPVRIESIVVPDEAGKRLLCQSVLVNTRATHETHETDYDLDTSEAAVPAMLETGAYAITGGDAKARTESLQTTEEQIETLREQHDLAERLLATAPAIVLVLDLDGCIVRFNDHFEEITGYALKEVRGDDWFTTFQPDEDQEKVRADFARTLNGEIPSGTINPIRTKQGSDVPIEWHHTLLRDARAIACGSLSIGHDVTRRRQLDESQRQASVRAFAAGVAREVDNPVNKLVNCALLLLDGNPVRDSCKIILEESARISRIVKHLQQFSRDDRAAQFTSLAEVVSRTASLHEENFERQGIGLQVEMSANLPRVLAHPQQLQHVLVNLLNNARDALLSKPPANPHVAIRVGVEGARVTCRVRDNGPGIAPDVVQHVFEPFVTTNRARGATGLGLFISKSIIETMGGRLTVQSVPGQFAEFTFELPHVGPG